MSSEKSIDQPEVKSGQVALRDLQIGGRKQPEI